MDFETDTILQGDFNNAEASGSGSGSESGTFPDPPNLAALPVKRGKNPTGINGKRPSPSLTPWLKGVLEGYYASGMREWKDINTRLGLEHGDEFKFGSRAAYFRATRILGVGSNRKLSLSEEDKAILRRARRAKRRLLVRSGVKVPARYTPLDGIPFDSSDYHTPDSPIHEHEHEREDEDEHEYDNMSMSKPSTALVLLKLSETSLSTLRSTFNTVHYHPPSSTSPSSSILNEVDIIFGPPGKAPVKSFNELPKLRYIQLGSAGADAAISALQKWGGKGDHVKMMTASGTHVLSIPPWAVGCVIMLYHQIPRMLGIARNERRWANEQECDINGETYVARSLRGRTVGMLGYGALGRETARLLKSHGMKVIAANTSGKATTQDGYIIPGTGDKEGKIPSAYYSTKDDSSFQEFLSQADVLIASLPNTKNTAYLLDAKKLAMLPPNALFVNFGRGNLVKSDDLITALDKKDGLFGAALDVTDPEPLPDNHPLWTHPKVIITPHVSGNTEGEMDIAVEILVENVRRLESGEGVVNEVDFSRGY